MVNDHANNIQKHTTNHLENKDHPDFFPFVLLPRSQQFPSNHSQSKQGASIMHSRGYCVPVHNLVLFVL